jgi:hypothetical protein
MTVTTICGKCKRMRPCACPTTDPHKIRKARTKKYNSAHWQRIRARRLKISPSCADCGHPGSKTNPLTVDLLVGHDHSRARLEDTRTRCRVCHGRKDGGKR